MVLDPISRTLLERIDKSARERLMNGKEVDYKAKCPHCGAHVIIYQLKKNGCFICGWRPKE